MSTFDGHLLEYPSISIDRFVGTNLQSTVYFLSHCHKDHIEGLCEQAFFERLKKGSGTYLYVSETTKNLLSCDSDLKHLSPYVVGIPVHQPKEICFSHGSSENDTIVVTLISAGHCVGSVMILIEGKEGTVLYTGDFRLNKNQLSKVACLHAGERVRPLQSIYVDTTFCVPQQKYLPSREQTKDVLIDIIKRWIEKGKDHVVHLKCKGKYGYEYIMKEVASYFKTKIHVNNWRLQMSRYLPDMLQYFTTDPNITQIHCCYYGSKSTDSYTRLPCHQDVNDKNYKMSTIIPSSLYFMKQGIPKDYRKYIAHLKLWRVVHSMHASYEEIREVVGYLKPKNIYPFVPPVDSQDILVAYQRLQDLARETAIRSPRSLPDKSGSPSRFHSDKVILQNHFLLSPRSANRQYALFGLDSSLQEVKSPPPLRHRRKRRSKIQSKIRSKSPKNTIKAALNDTNEKSVDDVLKEQEIYTTNELLDEAFGYSALKKPNLKFQPSCRIVDNNTAPEATVHIQNRPREKFWSSDFLLSSEYESIDRSHVENSPPLSKHNLNQSFCSPFQKQSAKYDENTFEVFQQEEEEFNERESTINLLKNSSGVSEKKDSQEDFWAIPDSEYGLSASNKLKHTCHDTDRSDATEVTDVCRATYRNDATEVTDNCTNGKVSDEEFVSSSIATIESSISSTDIEKVENEILKTSKILSDQSSTQESSDQTIVSESVEYFTSGIGSILVEDVESKHAVSQSEKVSPAKKLIQVIENISKDFRKNISPTINARKNLTAQFNLDESIEINDIVSKDQFTLGNEGFSKNNVTTNHLENESETVFTNQRTIENNSISMNITANQLVNKNESISTNNFTNNQLANESETTFTNNITKNQLANESETTSTDDITKNQLASESVVIEISSADETSRDSDLTLSLSESVAEDSFENSQLLE